MTITGRFNSEIIRKIIAKSWFLRYIHDLPKLSSPSRKEPSSFEAGLLAHLLALNTPDDFVSLIRGMYDYSKVGVHLITSIPGTHSGSKAELHGLLRLRRVIKDLKLKLPKKVSEGGELRLEVCTASLGKLNARWLNAFNDCALGTETIGVLDHERDVPDIKLFYPSVGDVRKAHESAQEAASNIGSHLRPWDTAPDAIKRLYHHYQSKDKGWLFHQKLILLYNVREITAPPYYVYIGSANLSASAWGTIEKDKTKQANEATCKTKIKMNNFECGVVVPGHLIEGLLEPGTKSWQDGIVPYDQASQRYDLSKDRAWNDPKWNADYREDYQGS